MVNISFFLFCTSIYISSVNIFLNSKYLRIYCVFFDCKQ
nr:MAG TPA: hypothetical protein [Caudoviricetes sp.]